MLPSTPFAVRFVLSVTLGSYLSKSFGSSSSGCLMSFKLPVPPTTTLTLTGEPALTSVLSSWAEILNRPTPPENWAGLFGRGSTWILMPGASTSLFSSIYPEPPFKKASKGSTFLFSWTTTPLNVMGGISKSPVICGYITYWLHVTQW